MALDYPHTITVDEPPETDGLGRVTTPGATVYDGNADVQEGGVERTDRSGQTFRVGDATIFTPHFLDVQPGDAVTITWTDGTTQAATVSEVSRLDDRFIVSYD